VKDVMKILVYVSALLLGGGSLLYGQAVPSGNTTISSTGSNPNSPPLDGILHYALSASQVVQFGFYGSNVTTSSTDLSGDVAYTAKSETMPFNMVLAGGVLLSNGQGQGTSTFWNIGATQGLITRHWAFNVSDSFSFLPQSPTTGLSGIPGVGDLGAVPVTGPAQGPGGGVLTFSGNRAINQLSGSAERQLSPATSISGTGSWSIIHFFDENAGVSSSGVSGSVALNRRLDARSSASVNAVYTTYSYSNTQLSALYPDFQTKGINASYQRLMSRSVSINLSAGPLWISSSNSSQIPSRLSAAGSANLNYTHGLTTASLGYSRGVNAGSGVLAGALSDTATGTLAHTYGRKWVASADVGYAHSAGLTELLVASSPTAVNEVYETFFGGVQVTHGFTPHLSGYASFTVTHQSSNYPIPTQNAFTGTSQIFGVGITFTPRSTRLGQF
jgi:hypothetical protein